MQTSSRKTASLWLCYVHNLVNKRLKKEEFDCTKLDSTYDCGCGDDPLIAKEKDAEKKDKKEDKKEDDEKKKDEDKGKKDKDSKHTESDFQKEHGHDEHDDEDEDDHPGPGPIDEYTGERLIKGG
jgi:hypothetical protein